MCYVVREVFMHQEIVDSTEDCRSCHYFSYEFDAMELPYCVR